MRAPRDTRNKEDSSLNCYDRGSSPVIDKSRTGSDSDGMLRPSRGYNFFWCSIKPSGKLGPIIKGYAQVRTRNLACGSKGANFSNSAGTDTAPRVTWLHQLQNCPGQESLCGSRWGGLQNSVRRLLAQRLHRRR